MMTFFPAFKCPFRQYFDVLGGIMCSSTECCFQVGDCLVDVNILPYDKALAEPENVQSSVVVAT